MSIAAEENSGLSELSPDNHQPDPTGENMLTALPQGSVFTHLNAIFLSIEWEITDEIMAKFLAEIENLKGKLHKNKILYAFLQLQGTVGKYIIAKKVTAHPDSIKLLHSVHSGLVKILTTPKMTESEKKEILSREISKFKALKDKLLQAKRDAMEMPSAKRHGTKRVKLSEVIASPTLPEVIAMAVKEVKTFIRDEFKTLKEDLYLLKKGH